MSSSITNVRNDVLNYPKKNKLEIYKITDPEIQAKIHYLKMDRSIRCPNDFVPIFTQ
jgi:hypothetical protein